MTVARLNKNPGCIKANGWNEADDWQTNVIRCARDPWQGSLTVGCLSAGGKLYPIMMDRRGHAIFADLPHGVRAMAKLALNKYKGGLKTLAQLIGDKDRGWAPASDTQGSIPGRPANDPLAYARQIAKWTGVGVHEDLALVDSQGLADRDRLSAVCHGIERYEEGARWVNDEDWRRGIELAAGAK